MALVELSEQERQEYLLLRPVYSPPRTGNNFQLIHPIEFFPDIIQSLRQSPTVAVDFETRGNDYSHPDFEAVGIGFSWDEGSCYFTMSDLSREEKEQITELLNTHKGLIAHNVYFDGGVARQCFGARPKWKYCTYSLYSYLANEGYAGRSWGLKVAQTDLLLWESSNETELDKWLVLNGHYVGTQRKDSTPEYLEEQFLSGGLRPDKGEMWRAPVDILGKYCILDAESTYLLYMNVLLPCLRKFPDLDEFISIHWMNLIQLLIRQKIAGIEMDIPGLVARKNTILAEVSQIDNQIDTDPLLVPHIRAIEKELLEKKGPQKPERLKKNGEISKNYIKWEARMDLITRRQDPEFRFNVQSAVQLRDLLYNRLGYEKKIFSEKGEPSTAGKALQSMGGIGAILSHRNGLVKELGYIEKYIELTRDRTTIHPNFRTPGTTTGRLSSNNINLQQVPKSKAVMSLFKARPGKVLIDLDFSALEPVVATEYSQDENMLNIYGDNRPPNDIYCFVMANIPGMEERARALGYDPYNPTKESLALVKKEMKKERSICKTVVLACLEEGTPIRVRGKGWVPIEQVVKGDTVWDGFKWVNTEGAIYKGIKGVTNLHNVRLTPDHKVLGEDYVWREAKEYKISEGTNSPQPLRPSKPSADWSDVWSLGSRILRSYTRKWVQKNTSRLQMWIQNLAKLR